MQLENCEIGGVTQWLRRSVSNLVRSTRVGSNPFDSTINHSQQPTQLSVPSGSVNEYSAVALRAQAVMLQPTSAV